MRKYFVVVLGLAWLLVGGGSAADAQPPQKPNPLVVSIEKLGARAAVCEANVEALKTYAAGLEADLAAERAKNAKAEPAPAPDKK